MWTVQGWLMRGPPLAVYQEIGGCKMHGFFDGAVCLREGRKEGVMWGG